MTTHARHLLALSVTALIAACGGGDGDGGGNNPPVTVSAPTITTAPASSTVNAGGTVTLTVVASGDGALSYQWKRDGVDIPGATSASYTTPVLAVADSGKSYTVAVSNAGGQSTTSAAAVLTVNAVPVTQVAATQEAANQLVADVNAGVAQLSQAGLVGGLLPLGAQTLALPVGAVQTIPLAYCNTGSANMTLTTNDTTGQPVSAALVYSNCNTSFGGTSSSVNGTANFTVTAWTNELNYTLNLAYDITYTVSGVGGTETGRYNGQQTCTVVNDIEACSTTVGDNTVRDVSVRTDGPVTTVDSGRITNANIDCVYTGWVYDSSRGRATAGTVTVTAPNGDRAVLTVTSSGYSVVITVGGVTSSFSVAFPS